MLKFESLLTFYKIVNSKIFLISHICFKNRTLSIIKELIATYYQTMVVGIGLVEISFSWISF